MRVGLLTGSLEVGGTERQIALLAAGLQRAGDEVAVFSMYGSGPLGDHLSRSGVRVVSLAKRRRWDISSFVGLATAVRDFGPDAIYSFLPTQNLFAIALRPFVSSSAVVWGVRAPQLDLPEYDWFVRATSRLEPRLGWLADLIIVNSRSIELGAKARGYPTGRVRLIPNGVDTDRFAPEGANSVVDGCANQTAGHRLIGLVARLDPVKDHKTFLRAAAIVRQAREDLRFLCVGGGPVEYASELRRYASSLGLDECLEWAGEQLNMPGVYRKLDVLCLSSKSEGFPNVIGEAMASGIPCVATDVGDCAWVIGDTGRVVPPNDPAAMASAVLDVIGDLEKDPSAVRTRARQQILANFSEHNMIASTRAALGAAIKPTAPGGAAPR